MQMDFHHATTYTLARLAGFGHGDARVVAQAAQYVDDATEAGSLAFENHAPLARLASAHPFLPGGPVTLTQLEQLNQMDKVETWTTCHFLPGNGGLPAGQGLDLPLVERFVCREDSPVAAAMGRACLGALDSPHGLHRLGITAHVLADMWAHRGFVGFKHPRNQIRDIGDGETTFMAVMAATPSRTWWLLPLGHAMALTLPDLPYLRWSFMDSRGVETTRDNPQACLQASQALLALFGAASGRQEAHLSAEDQRALLAAFSNLKLVDGHARHQAWLALLGQPVFSFGALTGAELAELHYAVTGPGSWQDQALGPVRGEHGAGPYQWTPAFETSHWKLFQEALGDHRQALLGEILPSFGLSVGAVLAVAKA